MYQLFEVEVRGMGRGLVHMSLELVYLDNVVHPDP